MGKDGKTTALTWYMKGLLVRTDPKKIASRRSRPLRDSCPPKRRRGPCCGHKFIDIATQWSAGEVEKHAPTDLSSNRHRCFESRSKRKGVSSIPCEYDVIARNMSLKARKLWTGRRGP